MRVTSQDFQAGWLGVLKKDGLDEQLYFRRKVSSPNA
jgi:hypothetical protein